ncbi:MAG: hypothetical protein KAR40_07870 [Candidatus Sabulitectum sp.]|nr:hypothetical protein [Candidatus Sabulitectum sp.]
MSFNITTWVDDDIPAITAAQLNRIETGIGDAHDDIATNVTAIALNTTGTVQAIRGAVLNRKYDAVVIVSTTITAALSSIADNSGSKRYLVYVPDGTYNEEITGRSFIDIVGESVDGVIIQSSSGTDDTVDFGGIEAMLSNLTVNHTFNTGDAGLTQYPIHIDKAATGLTPGGNGSSGGNVTTIVNRVKTNSIGTGSKAGVGIGSRAKQRVYLVDSQFESEASVGIFAHNSAGQSEIVSLFLVNSKGTGAPYGFQWNNEGSTQDDFIGIMGGTYSGTTADIALLDSGGSGEAYVYVSDDVIAPTIALTNPADRLFGVDTFQLPKTIDPVFKEYTGDLYTDPLGLKLGVGGALQTLRADQRLYLSDNSGNFLYFKRGLAVPSDLYRFAFGPDTLDNISSPLAGYLRFTCGNDIVAQFRGGVSAAFYRNILPNSNGSISLGTANSGFNGLFMDYTNTATVGNVTIDKASGRVNITAAASSITVTNNKVKAASKVFCEICENDATAWIKNVVPAAGSFTINLGAAATANTAVNFFVVGAD